MTCDKKLAVVYGQRKTNKFYRQRSKERRVNIFLCNKNYNIYSISLQLLAELVTITLHITEMDYVEAAKDNSAIDVTESLSQENLDSVEEKTDKGTEIQFLYFIARI